MVQVQCFSDGRERWEDGEEAIGLTYAIGEENFGFADRKESHRREDIGEIIVIDRGDLEFADGKSLADKREIQAARAISVGLSPMEEIMKQKAIGQKRASAKVFLDSPMAIITPMGGKGKR